jgi:hypothetical protein
LTRSLAGRSLLSKLTAIRQNFVQGAPAFLGVLGGDRVSTFAILCIVLLIGWLGARFAFPARC